MGLSSAFLCLCGSICLSLHAAAFAHGPQARNRKLPEPRKNSPSAHFTVQTNGPASVLAATDEFPVYTFSQPLDHYSVDSPTFNQRYWISTRHYIPGSNGPVVLIDGGEGSGEDLLPRLDTGIVDIITNAVGGIGIILEHRYVCPELPPRTPHSFLAILVIPSQLLWSVYPLTSVCLSVLR